MPDNNQCLVKFRSPHNWRAAGPVVVLGFALVATMIAGRLVPLGAQDAGKFQNADEAWRVGVAFYNSRNFAAAQGPFEAALKLSNDKAFRLKVYEALRASYRLLPDSDKMVEACEYCLDNNESAPAKSLCRRELLSFIYQRGKIDDLVKRHEARLKENKEDRTALYVLSEIYSEIKKDPERAAQLVEQLAALEKKSGKPLDIHSSANLASQYVKSKKFKEGAELYESIAPESKEMTAWHWKEAAAAWLKAKEPNKALAAAKQSAKSDPEKRSQLLTHFWHRNLGDVFLATGEPKLAVEHFEKAIENTTIEGYVKDCRASLEEAKKKAALKGN